VNPQYLVGLAMVLTSLAGIAWAIRWYQRGQTTVDRILHPPAIDTQPGHDTDLLLDCIEAWDDPDGYRRLRNAIHQPRKEDTP
jgi:hypothetical protein